MFKNYIFIIFLCVYTILINSFYLSYNENLLLSLLFILFFCLVYILSNKIVKNIIVNNLYKNYFLILFTSKINFVFNKLLICINIIKNNFIMKNAYKIMLLKKSYLMFINELFSDYLTFLIFFNFYYLNNKIKNIKNKYNNNFEIIKDQRINDLYLFF